MYCSTNRQNNVNQYYLPYNDVSHAPVPSNFIDKIVYKTCAVTLIFNAHHGTLLQPSWCKTPKPVMVQDTQTRDGARHPNP